MIALAQCLQPRTALSRFPPLIGPDSKDRFGAGFRTPAPCGTAVRVAGPAFESLPRRKPRVGRGAVWSGATTYGDLRMRDGGLAGFRERVAGIVLGGKEGEVRFRERGSKGRE